MKQKMLAMVLACLLVLGLLPMVGAADTSWKAWSQGDSRWGSMSIAANGDSSKTMGRLGCLVVAINKILIHSGQQDPSSFTPADCAKALLATNMLSNNAGILYGNYNKTFLPTYGPELTHESSSSHGAWDKSTAVSTVSGKINSGYYVIVCVKNKSTGNTHWMAVDYVGDDIYVMDNGGVIPLYGTSKYNGGVTDQVYFKYSGSKSYPASASDPEPSTLSINPTSEPGEHRNAGAAFYFRGSITSNYNVTSATIQVRGADNASVVMEKTVTPNKTNVDILKDGLDSLKFGSLGEGNYYLWLFAQDSSGKTAEWCVHFSVGYPVEPAPKPEPEPSPEPVVPNCDNGHTFGEWKTVKEASCGIEGQRERVCSVCGEKETETIAALEHNYRVDGETDEAIYYVCTNCGDNYTVEKERPAGDKGGFAKFIVKNRYNSESFGDVKSGDWFYENVKTTYELGLMKGTGSGTFSPGNNVTLAETITLAARIHSIYYTGSDDFASYDGGNWYDPYVDYARENNIVNTYYNYSRPATREEFVHILANALPQEALENITGRVSFADSGDITYMAEVRLLSGAGVINGIKEDGKTYFKPLNTITRAEVAAVVGRMAIPGSRVR